jgi:hypothetical protein
MQDGLGVAAVDAAGQQDHVGAQALDLAKPFCGEFKRRRADDLRARAEGGLIGSFNGQTRHVADDGDAQAAGGAAARQHRLSLETR